MRINSSVATAVLSLIFIIRGSAAADRVSSDGGQIVLEYSSGRKTTLTQGGFNSDPWLSPDGRSVVYLSHSAEDMFRTSVNEINIESGTSKLLFSGPAKYRGRESSSFGRPELNEAHDKLFLISHEYSTSGALIAVYLPSGQTTLIADEVVGYDLIHCPKKYRGDLVALKRHEENILGRPYFLYHLYSPVGLDLGLAGDGELDADLDFVRQGSCEEQGQRPSPSITLGSTRMIPPARDALRTNGSVGDLQSGGRVEPTYPAEAVAQHIEGDVRLQVRVAADGTVEDVNLVSGPPQLVEAAITAVRKWRFRPTITTNPSSSVTFVNVPFRLPSKDR